MPDLEPITREEKLLDGEDLTPITRKEKFIKRIYDKTQEIPEPITREEMFLKKAGEGGGGDIDLQTLNVTENGTVNAPSGVAYNKVVTDVPQPTMTKLTATENRTYTAPSGTAYNEVDVDVPLPSNAYLLKELSNLPQPIASFSDGADAVMQSLKVAIEPVQSGSGDPSPSNVRPISGWTEEVASVRGKNNVDGGTLTPSASNTNYPISPTLAKGNYVLSFDVSNLAWTNLNNTAFAWTKDSNNTQKDLLSHSIKRVSDNAYLKDLTQPVTGRFYGVFSNVEVASLVIACRNNTYMNFTSGTITNIQLESGSTPSDFEPYAGTTTTIPFTDSQDNPVAVYGGSVDVVNGIVTPAPYYASYNGENLTGEWISDRDVYSPNTTPTIGAQVVNIGATGTPFSVQPTSIKSLDGDNNVFASTGDVEELKYFSKEV